MQRLRCPGRRSACRNDETTQLKKNKEKQDPPGSYSTKTWGRLRAAPMGAARAAHSSSLSAFFFFLSFFSFFALFDPSSPFDFFLGASSCSAKQAAEG